MKETIIAALIGAALLAGAGLAIKSYGNKRYDAGYKAAADTYQAAIDKQRREAVDKLAAETEKVRVARADLQALTTKIEKDRDDAQAKNAADLRKRTAGPRLQFTPEAGRGGGCSRAEAGALGAAKDASPAKIQLPEPLNGNLLQLAADAQSLAIDYGVLYEYLHNPKLVCELRP